MTHERHTIVVSNRGPLTFRAEPGGALVPVPAAGGLASSLHRILAGSGTTWASVTMGAADREAVAQGLMHEDGLDLLPVVIDDATYRQAYDVVANTTLWYCHHHLFDLPHRPRFDRHWREAWEGYRAYNRAMADVWRRGRARAPPSSCRTITSRCSDGCWPRRGPTCARSTSCTRRSPRPPCWRCCPTTCGRSCSTAWPATRPAASTATSGRRASWGVTPRPAVRRARPRRSWRRSVPTWTCSRRRRRLRRVWRRPLRCGPTWAVAASSPARTAWSLRRTSCGGCSPSRNC